MPIYENVANRYFYMLIFNWVLVEGNFVMVKFLLDAPNNILRMMFGLVS